MSTPNAPSQLGDRVEDYEDFAGTTPARRPTTTPPPLTLQDTLQMVMQSLSSLTRQVQQLEARQQAQAPPSRPPSPSIGSIASSHATLHGSNPGETTTTSGPYSPALSTMQGEHDVIDYLAARPFQFSPSFLAVLSKIHTLRDFNDVFSLHQLHLLSVLREIDDAQSLQGIEKYRFNLITLMAFSDFIQYEDLPSGHPVHDQHTFSPTRFAFYRDANTPNLDGILNKHLKEYAAVFQTQSSGGFHPPSPTAPLSGPAGFPSAQSSGRFHPPPPTVPSSGPAGFPSTPTVTGPTSVTHHGYRQSQRPYRQPRGDPTHLVRTKIQDKQTRSLAIRTRTRAQPTSTAHRRIGLQ